VDSYLIYGASNFDQLSTVDFNNLTNQAGSILRNFCVSGYCYFASVDLNNDAYLDVVIGDPVSNKGIVLFGSGARFSSVVDYSGLLDGIDFIEITGTGPSIGYSVDGLGDGKMTPIKHIYYWYPN